MENGLLGSFFNFFGFFNFKNHVDDQRYPAGKINWKRCVSIFICCLMAVGGVLTWILSRYFFDSFDSIVSALILGVLMLVSAMEFV